MNPSSQRTASADLLKTVNPLRSSARGDGTACTGFGTRPARFRTGMGWFLLWVLGAWFAGAAAQPTPYSGTPHPVPGTIEAEEYDLGGEGVAFHGLGLIVTNAGVIIEFPPGRSGDSIPAVGTDVILRTGEWLNYSVMCEQDGYYTVLFRTSGPPYYEAGCFPASDRTCFYSGEISVHLEVDGQRASGAIRLQSQTAHSRVWMNSGPHQVRVVVDQVSDLFIRAGSPPGAWDKFSFGLNSIQLRPALVPLFPVPMAGGRPGFKDGPGAEALFGYMPTLVAEQPGGEVIVQDTANAALRMVSRDGRVRTLAGSPGNPVDDGVGVAAGFGQIQHTLLAPEGHLWVLEWYGMTSDRLRRVEPDGTVSTLYQGRVEVPVVDPFLGPTTQVVRLSRVVLTPAGKVRLVGAYTRYEVVDLIHGEPVFGDVTRSAFFELDGGVATLVDTLQVPLAPVEIQGWDDGYHREVGGFPYQGILYEQPTGFIERVTPDVPLVSVLRLGDGTFLCISLEAASQISRMVPVPASRLRVDWIGEGTIEGIPWKMVPPETDIRLEARPFTRFTQFLGWSDGSQENPRTLRISRDTSLTATFGLRIPEPHGLVGNRLQVGQDRSFQMSVVGNAVPYQYLVEISRDLVRWTPPPPGTKVPFKDGTYASGLLSARAPNTWLSIPYIGTQLYVRVKLLDQ